MVGRLAGTLDGRPWSFQSDVGSLSIELPNFASLLKLRRLSHIYRSSVKPMALSLNARVRFKCGTFPALTVGSQSLFFKMLLAWM
ncbi:hypothetical protein LBMAG51_03480 [Phycisphaerae bacterium]|nr:hypothetical protein LBMAG51_03480 [Phycisphaerae bacterium]